MIEAIRKKPGFPLEAGFFRPDASCIVPLQQPSGGLRNRGITPMSRAVRRIYPPPPLGCHQPTENAMPLTEIALRSLRANPRPGRHSDKDGLFLKIDAREG
jgi:hypothetical protein